MAKKKSRNIAVKALKVAGTLLSLALAAAVVTSAYAGMADPMEWNYLPMAGLAFPVVLGAAAALLVVWLLLRQFRMAAILAVALAVSWGPIFTFSPINIGGATSDDDKPQSFSLLTYNALNFWDFTTGEKAPTPNRTLEFILQTDADIVCVQEMPTELRMEKWERDYAKSITEKLCERYPYHSNKRQGLMTFSKYPIKATNDSVYSANDIVYVGHDISIQGHTLRVYNCHMQSLSLTDTDKAIFSDIRQIASHNEQDLAQAHDLLTTKLLTAFRSRSLQAKKLREKIDTCSVDNVIVCGDFNDTPGSFAYRTILGDDMSDAYRDCALGPTITFHSNHLYFRIDHVLYRGAMKAVDIDRPDIDCSDHYPLLATLAWD